jgi:hypothetical protein
MLFRDKLTFSATGLVPDFSSQESRSFEHAEKGTKRGPRLPDELRWMQVSHPARSETLPCGCAAQRKKKALAKREEH